MVRYIAESEEDFQTIQEAPPSGYLTLIVDGRISHSFPLRDEVNMGREKGNAIVVADQKISRHHANLLSIDNTFIISDLGSANGTYVNGVLIGQPTRLKNNDHIRLGDTMFLYTTHQPDPNAIDNLAAPAPSSAVPHPPPINIAPTIEKNSIPMWALIGCMVVTIMILLFMVAVLLGLSIGRTGLAG